MLASGPENLDAACSASSALWQVLSARYGVLLMAAATAGADAAPPPGAGAAEAGIVDLLESTVSLMVREYSAGCPYAELAKVGHVLAWGLVWGLAGGLGVYQTCACALTCMHVRMPACA